MEHGNRFAFTAQYSPDNPEGKKICKTHLQEAFGLDVAPDVPLFTVVSRLVEQRVWIYSLQLVSV